MRFGHSGRTGAPVRGDSRGDQPHRPGWPANGRLAAAEALSREAALGAYTTGAAYSLFAEDRLGRIAKGMRADFLFVDADPMTASPEQLRATRVLETWIGGKLAWSAAQDGGKAGVRR
ncbi:amidohydrolase family protein [Novosphingobium panipatense]